MSTPLVIQLLKAKQTELQHVRTLVNDCTPIDRKAERSKEGFIRSLDRQLQDIKEELACLSTSKT